MEIFNDIIQTTLNSFDFAFCITINVLTYVIIKIIDELNKEKEVNVWIKRGVLLFSILLTGVVYYICNVDIKLLFNSAILATVIWSWIFKPICKKLKVDYKEIDKTLTH